MSDVCIKQLFTSLRSFVIKYICTKSPSYQDTEADSIRQIKDRKLYFNIRYQTFVNNPYFNTAILTEEQLKDIYNYAKSGFNISYESLVTQVADAYKNKISKGEEPWPDEKATKDIISNFEAIKYLCVIRTSNYIPPRTDSDSQFTKGVYSGQVMLFDIDNAEFIGGFSIQGLSSDIDEIHANKTTADADLKKNVQKSFNTVFKYYVDNSVGFDIQ